MEERDSRVYWSVWIRWPGTSDPQEYRALVDTGAQCTLMPSEFKGSESICISGVTGGSQDLSVLEAEVSLIGQHWQKHPSSGPSIRSMSLQFRDNDVMLDNVKCFAQVK